MLVGRETELQAVRDVLAAVSGPVGIVLEGEAGIGKTALWQAGLAEAEQREFRVLSARAAESETGLSHAALGGPTRPTRRPGGRGDAGTAAPRAGRGAPASGTPRQPVDPRAVGAATLAALKAASGDTPLVLAVDDVQWLDPASGGALAFALRRLTDDRVVLFATRRAGPGAEQLDLGCGMRGALRLTEEGIAIQAASYGEQAQGGAVRWSRSTWVICSLPANWPSER